jgi:hypothetical protein
MVAQVSQRATGPQAADSINARACTPDAIHQADSGSTVKRLVSDVLRFVTRGFAARRALDNRVHDSSSASSNATRASHSSFVYSLIALSFVSRDYHVQTYTLGHTIATTFNENAARVDSW